MSDIISFLSGKTATSLSPLGRPYLAAVGALADRFLVIGNGTSANTIESFNLSYVRTVLLSSQTYNLVAATSNRLFLGKKTGTDGTLSVDMTDLSGSYISSFDTRGIGSSGGHHLIQTIKSLTSDGTYVYVHGTGDWTYGGGSLVQIVHKYDLTGAFIAEYGFNDDVMEIAVYGGNLYCYSSDNKISARDFSGTIAYQITAADSNGTVSISAIAVNSDGIYVAYPVTGPYQGILCYDLTFSLKQTYKSALISSSPGTTHTKLMAQPNLLVVVYA